MEKLEGWIFTFNSFTGKWQATKRENYALLFNDIQNSKVLKSSKFETLQELIIKTDGDSKKLNKLIRK
jgi:hypothetical protein